MSDTPLLDKLKRLVAIDQAVSFDNQNPDIYRRRAEVLQELGLNSLALYDYRICAFLEQKDAEFYHRDYRPLLDFAAFERLYQSEKQTNYYQILADILYNDKELLKNTIDPIHFALRSGNATNLGLFNLALRDCNDAMKYLADFPQEYAISAVNKALLLLLTGNYEQGWELYEKRWETYYKAFKQPLSLPRPKWQGEPLSSHDCLLIHAEQGIGDNIQFVRYAIYLKQQGIKVLVWNNAYIHDFLKDNLARYGIETVTQNDSIPFSHWVSMMSLPHLCHTTLHHVPLTAAYLQTPEAYRQKWQSKLPAASRKRKIGIVWRGGSQTDTDKIRSIPLEQFATLFQADADFYVIQKDVSPTESDLLARYSHVYDLHQELDSFSDTAAIIEQMDLLICVDTSVAHLAAAMGKPTWILITYKPDFRWLLHTGKSIWYESVTLFRQDLDYEWQPVLTRVADSLNHFLNDE